MKKYLPWLAVLLFLMLAVDFAFGSAEISRFTAVMTALGGAVWAWPESKKDSIE